MMKFDSKGRLVFNLKSCYFLEWKARHQISITTNFKAHDKAHEYVSEDPRGAIALQRRTAGSILTKFECHRRGKKREKKGSLPGGKSGKRRVRAKAIPCGCKSYFNAVFQPRTVAGKGKVADIYCIEYRLDHNHELGEDGGIGTLQESRAIKDQIKALLLRGMSIATVMNRMTMDHAKFTQLLTSNDGNPRWTRDDFITYDDIYNILYAITVTRIRKAENPDISAGLWMESLKQQGYFVYYDTEQSVYHGFSSPWQLNELSKWGNVVCFDGTHHACGRDTYLYTVVVKNRDTGFGIPVAFFLTKDPKWQVPEGWLKALKNNMDELYDREFQPTVVITDQGQIEINAIQAVWPLGTRIFYCAWHLLQAWERKLTEQNLGSSNLSTIEMDHRKRKVRAELRYILYARTEGEADTLMEAFGDAWQDLAPSLVQFLDKNYFDHPADRRQWMFCHRADISYAWINPNNYIESWHNSFKKHFFKDKQQRRLDTVVHTLVQTAIPHYQQMCNRHSMQIGRVSPGARETLKANLLASNYMEQKRAEDPEITFLIPTADWAVFQVQSFQGPPTVYDVKVD